MASEPALHLRYLEAALTFDDDLAAAVAWCRFSAGVRRRGAGRDGEERRDLTLCFCH